jgi:methionine-S-sulfoxide reductase
MTIDPLSVNRQGGDFGTQYRTGIYYTDRSLIADISKVIGEETDKAGRSLAVEVKPLESFWEAEEYHQKYLDKNPLGYCHIPRNLLHLNNK